jgi:hypothetical protein
MVAQAIRRPRQGVKTTLQSTSLLRTLQLEGWSCWPAGERVYVMHMPKAIKAVAHWLAAGNNFDRLSCDERRVAWSSALLTHVLLMPATYAIVQLAPALRPTFGAYLMVHFLVALLFAKVAEGTSAIWELVLRKKPRFESNGWLFAFSVLLLPLLVTSFSFWLLS